jgi:hypothetical protein
MKSLIKKSLKYSFTAVVALKAGDTLFAYRNQFNSRSPAFADKSDDEKIDDYIRM